MLDWNQLRQRLARAFQDADSRAERHIIAGNAHVRDGALEHALGEYQAAIQLNPGSARAHFNCGVVLQQLRRPKDAVRSYEAALAADPSSVPAWVNLGHVLKELGGIDRAFDMFQKALALDPSDVKALVNSGAVLMGRGELDLAMEHYIRALDLEPDNADALNNCAAIVQQKGDFARAKSLYERAAATKEGFVDAQYNLGLLALTHGDFARGWEAYELRFRTHPPAASLGALPLAMAEPADLVPGRRIAIRKEQGIGDQILFSTLLPDLAARGVDALVEVDARLLAAYRRAIPALRFISPDELQDAHGGCEMQFPVGSLPRVFRRDAEDFRRQPRALLSPDPERVVQMRERLGAGRRIAVAWRSFQAKDRRHVQARKSAALDCFGALEACGATLVDVQYGEAAAERECFDARYPGLRQVVPGLDLFRDLEGVLAALACCDLVVTTSNVTAHLAGIIGKPTWLVYLQANPPFPYWVPNAVGRSPWYPSVEILTHSSWTTWNVAFEQVAQRWISFTGQSPGECAQRLVELGNELYRRGEVESAAARYATAARRDKGCVRAHFNLGIAMESLGRLDAAAEHYKGAVAADPSHAPALVNLGNLLRGRGETDHAADLYRRALSLDPGDAKALNNLAGLSLERGDAENARVLYLRAIEAGGLEAHAGLGQVALQCGDTSAALEHFRRVLLMDPGNSAAHHGMGLALSKQGHDGEALRHYEKAASDPRKLGLLVDWADALARAGRRDEAATIYERALRVEPANAHVLARFASFHIRYGDSRGAQAYFEKAAQGDPDPLLRYNAGLMGLFNHEFETAWDDYALRFMFPPWRGSLTPCDLPEATSDNLATVRRLAVRKEQGLGDQILFGTALTEVAELGIDAVVELDRRLIPAFRRAFPAIRFVGKGESREAFSPCDHQVPLGSLQGIFRRRLEDFDRQSQSLLQADPGRQTEMAERLGPGPKVGIAWRSFREGIGDRKSFPLERFSVFDGTAARLIDLQYGAVEDERRAFDEKHPGLRMTIEGLDVFNDLEGLLAAITNCDLVVTASNVTAHLAGALGKRTWLLYLEGVPPFYYWSPSATGRSLWYPSVEILSDVEWSSWAQALEAVAARYVSETRA